MSWYDGTKLFYLASFKVSGIWGLTAGYGVSPFNVIKVNSATALNTWHHVVFTFSTAGVGKLYVNGALIGTDSSPTGAFNVSNALQIGRLEASAPGDDPFSGLIDEVAIWDTALTQEDVYRDYGAGDGIWPPPTSGRSAANYFLASSGSDSNTGLSGHPWQTIAKVNDFQLIPGDTLTINDGDTFDDNLIIAPWDAPTSGAKIIVQSTTNNATIGTGTSAGITVTNAGYVEIRNLIITGPGISVSGSFPSKTATTTHTVPAVYFRNSGLTTAYSGCKVIGCTISNALFGVRFYSTSATATAAYDSFVVSGNYIHECGVAGIVTYGERGSEPHQVAIGDLFTNCTIGGPNSADKNRIEDIFGITAYTYLNSSAGPSGFGILLANFTDGLVENNRIKRVAIASNNAIGGGACGIEMIEGSRTVFRRNFVKRAYAPESIDGVGIDLDLACDACTVERNICVDCDGSGFLSLGGGGSYGLRNNQNNKVHHNLVINCDTRSSGGVGSWRESGTEGKQYIYNNTFLQNIGGGVILSVTAQTYLANNIFASGASTSFGGSDTVGAVNGNCYRVFGGGSFSYASHNSLPSMQTAGLEKISGSNTGISGDPVFTTEGDSPDLAFADEIESYSAYDLGVASAAHGCGVDVTAAPFSITAPTLDLHGNAAIGCIVVIAAC